MIRHTLNCTVSNWGFACHSNNPNGCCFDSCEFLLLHLVSSEYIHLQSFVRNWDTTTCSCKYKQTLRNLEECWGRLYHSGYLFKMNIRWNQCLESYVISHIQTWTKHRQALRPHDSLWLVFFSLSAPFSLSQRVNYECIHHNIYIYYLYCSWILSEMWIYCLRKERGYCETLTKSNSWRGTYEYHSIPVFLL